MSQGTDSIAGRYGSQGLRLELRRREGGHCARAQWERRRTDQHVLRHTYRRRHLFERKTYELEHGEHRAGLRDEFMFGRRPHELHRSAPVLSIRCDAGSRRPVVCRMGHDAAFHLGREKTGVARCDCPQAARARRVRAAAGGCETFARAPQGGTSGTGRPTGRGSRNTGVSRGCGPADRPREGGLVPLPVSRPGRCVPGAVDEQQDRAHGLFPGMRQRMGAGRVREAAGALRGVSESGVRRGERPRDTRPPPGTPCRRRLSAA